MSGQAQVLYAPGQEPEALRERIVRLLAKLDTAYPDKVVRYLSRDHKKWSETVTELYRLLGYPDGRAFLAAYGYTVEGDAKGGRPAEDPMVVIGELKRRYADGPTCAKLDELKAENPDLAPKFKNLANSANKLFGMTLAKYLVQEGILVASGRNARAGVAAERAQAEYEKLRQRYADAPFCGTVSQIWDANGDLDWTAIRKYAQAQGLHLAELLRRDGILTNPRERALSTVQALRARFPDPERRPLTVDALRQAAPDVDLEELASDIWGVFHQDLAAFLTGNGVLARLEDLPAEERLAFFAATLRARYSGKALPTSAAVLQKQNPDISVADLDRWSKNSTGRSSVEFLLEQGLLDLTPAWLFEYENFCYWTRSGDDRFDPLHAFPPEGKRFFVTGQYAAPEELEQTAARLRERGGIVDGGPLRELDCIVGVHPNPCGWARRLELEGRPLWVISSGLLGRLLAADGSGKEA